VVQVGILERENLVEHVDDVDGRIAGHLGRDGRGLKAPVADGIELAEYRDCLDFCHNKPFSCAF